MTKPVLESGRAVRLSSTATVAAISGTLLGFYVANTSSGTLVLRHAGASGAQISGTITPAIGFHRFPADFDGGLHATITNTLDVTFFIQD